MAETLQEMAAEMAEVAYGAPGIAEFHGATYRAKIGPDEYRNIMDGDDGDWFGALAWAETDQRTGHHTRPDGFDGGAVKLRVGRSYDAVWWQPPADIAKDPGHVATMRATIMALIEYGYSVVTVERLAGTDAYGRGIVVAVESMGGVEAMASTDYLADVIGELLHEVVPAPTGRLTE